MGTEITRQEEADRLRRSGVAGRRGKEAARIVSGAAGKVLGGLASGIGRLMPRGGVRNPDDMITNRSLYMGSRGTPSPLPRGQRINSGKELLTGSPNMNPSPSPSRSRRTKSSRGRQLKKNPYSQDMARTRKRLRVI